MKQPCVYLLASRRNGTLYVGVTSDLIQRVWQHKNDLVEGFTRKYGVHRLVWYELYDTMETAIAREKAIKEWKRTWKIRLIEGFNPEWAHLYEHCYNSDGLSGISGPRPSFRRTLESSLSEHWTPAFAGVTDLF